MGTMVALATNLIYPNSDLANKNSTTTETSEKKPAIALVKYLGISV